MFARTARLMLRPGWPEDASALALAIGHEAVVSRLAHAPWPYALGDAQGFLASPRTPDAADFLIFDRPDDAPRLVGGMAIVANEADREFGYWLTPDAWGRGYATEAGRAVIAVARHALGLRQLVARPFLDNPASARVLEKLRFHASGEIVQQHCRARHAELPSARYTLDLTAGACGDPAMPLAA